MYFVLAPMIFSVSLDSSCVCPLCPPSSLRLFVSALLSDMKELRSSVTTIAKTTTQIARQQRLNELAPKLTAPSTSLVSNFTRSEEQETAPLRPKRKPLRTVSLTERQLPGSFSVPTTPTESIPPSTPRQSQTSISGPQLLSPRTSIWSNFQTMFWSSPVSLAQGPTI